MDTLVAVGDTPAGAAGIPAGAADTRRRRVDTLPEAEAGSHRRLARDSTGAALTLSKLFLKKNAQRIPYNSFWKARTRSPLLLQHRLR